MKVTDFKIGMRVKQRSDETSFVRDRRGQPKLKGRRIGIVIGMPERIGERHLAARIQFEGSTRVETLLIHRLTPLPKDQQPIALGGKWKPHATGGPFAGSAA
jgi:hypothetical protein